MHVFFPSTVSLTDVIKADTQGQKWSANTTPGASELGSRWIISLGVPPVQPPRLKFIRPQPNIPYLQNSQTHHFKDVAQITSSVFSVHSDYSSHIQNKLLLWKNILESTLFQHCLVSSLWAIKLYFGCFHWFAHFGSLNAMQNGNLSCEIIGLELYWCCPHFIV